MRKKALLVGIEHYHDKPLPGTVAQSRELGKLITTHHDGDPNFHCDYLLSDGQTVERGLLRRKLIDFFSNNRVHQGLLYFSGHGLVRDSGGYLVTMDAEDHDEGVSLYELRALAAKSAMQEIVIILDCCFSGNVFQFFTEDKTRTSLRKGMAILTATGREDKAEIRQGQSLFTQYLHQALDGEAADIMGQVTIGRLYEHLDQVMSPLEQRPQYASFLDQNILLREAAPAITKDLLRQLPKIFKRPNEPYSLSPAYEPTVEPHDAEKEAIFGVLQKLAKVGIVVPLGADHMYFAAMESKACMLTPLGNYYRHLVVKNKI